MTVPGSAAIASPSRSRWPTHRRSRVSRANEASPVTNVDRAVVEEGVRGEVRRAEREPAVVDDPDLGVRLHAVAGVAPSGPGRGGEEALMPLASVRGYSAHRGAIWCGRVYG